MAALPQSPSSQRSACAGKHLHRYVERALCKRKKGGRGVRRLVFVNADLFEGTLEAIFDATQLEGMFAYWNGMSSH